MSPKLTDNYEDKEKNKVQSWRCSIWNLATTETILVLAVTLKSDSSSHQGGLHECSAEAHSTAMRSLCENVNMDCITC